MTRDDVVAAARRYIGVRYLHQGRSEAGLDCAGLFVAVLRDLDQPVNDIQGYRRIPEGKEFLERLREHCGPRQPAPLPGCIGVFRQAMMPCHVGIFSEQENGLHVINAHISRRRVVEELFVPSKMTLMAVYDFPGLDAED